MAPIQAKRTPINALIEQLSAMPSGTLVPRDWVLAQLEFEEPYEEALGDLTLDEVASRARRAPSTIRGWLVQGLIPGAYKLRGRDWRVPPHALAEFFKREAEQRKKKQVSVREPTSDLGAWRKVYRGPGK